MRRPRTILPSPLAVLGAKFVYERQNQGFYKPFSTCFQANSRSAGLPFLFSKGISSNSGSKKLAHRPHSFEHVVKDRAPLIQRLYKHA